MYMHIRTKETCLYKRDLCFTKETCVYPKEPHIDAKETFIHDTAVFGVSIHHTAVFQWRLPLNTKEICVNPKEPYIDAKETCVNPKEGSVQSLFKRHGRLAMPST